jgi:hypothetical protein
MKKYIYVLVFLVGFGLFFTQSLRPDKLIYFSLRVIKAGNFGLKGRANLYTIAHHTDIEYWLIDDILPLIVKNDYREGKFERGTHPLERLSASSFFSRLAQAGAMEEIEKIKAFSKSLVSHEFNQKLLEEALRGVFGGINKFYRYHSDSGDIYDVEEEVNKYKDVMAERISEGSIIPENFPSDVTTWLNTRVAIYYGNGLRNIQSISALFGVSTNNLIKTIAPNPATWREASFGQRLLQLSEFGQLIQDLKDKSIIAQDIDYQDYYPF